MKFQVLWKILTRFVCHKPLINPNFERIVALNANLSACKTVRHERKKEKEKRNRVIPSLYIRCYSFASEVATLSSSEKNITNKITSTTKPKIHPLTPWALGSPNSPFVKDPSIGEKTPSKKSCSSWYIIDDQNKIVRRV